MRFAKTFRQGESGVAAVEFALLAPVFFLMIFGLIDFGRLYWLQSTMTYAVEAGGRYAMLNISAPDAEIVGQAQASIYGVDPSGITFTATNTSVNGFNYKTIRAKSTFDFVPGNLLPFGSITLSKQVRVPLLP